MSLDPLRATKAIKEKYLDYIETTYALNDHELHQNLELKKPERFLKVPFSKRRRLLKQATHYKI